MTARSAARPRRPASSSAPGRSTAFWARVRSRPSSAGARARAPLPPDGRRPPGDGPGIYLLRPGVDVRVRSWSPAAGPFVGYLITHMESLSIADHLTLREADRIVYRPTVHYAYCPCPDSVLSVHELVGRGFEPQPRQRILAGDIVQRPGRAGRAAGRPSARRLLVRLAAVDRARRAAIVPHANATALQVAAGILGGMAAAVGAAGPGPGRARAARLRAGAGDRAPLSRPPPRRWSRLDAAHRPRPAVPRDARPQRPLAVRQCPGGLSRRRSPSPGARLAMLVDCPYLFVGDAGSRGPRRVHGPADRAGAVIVADEDGSLRQRAVPLADGAGAGLGPGARAVPARPRPVPAAARLLRRSVQPFLRAVRRLAPDRCRRAVPGDPRPRRRRRAHLRLFLPPLEPRRADGLRLRDRVLPRPDRAVRHAAAGAAASLSAARGRVRRRCDAAAPDPAASPGGLARRAPSAVADRRRARRHPGRGDLGGEGRPVRGRQRQLPGRCTRPEQLAWVYLALAAIAATGALVLAPRARAVCVRSRRCCGCCWRRRSSSSPPPAPWPWRCPGAPWPC